uniref:Putative reverse transcriptase domain-containing protein n=1 Tax=Tanacetum cinerariifolium TaxID=118510 RepID=A0A6L2MLC2_TANCI|nr:putative reverse transcriptase domain-containing protein [Tanacetum cinerariifolium]
MSFPNHPTFDIEDVFSSNFPDYIPASLDYSPDSPGNTFSESSNNLSGLVLIASHTLSLFHDDPYMKVMHAYYAKESPILPPVIVPPSLMLSPMFNLQEFFLPKVLLPPKKRGRDQLSSSTSALPQEFKIREVSRKTSLERHEEQIKEILNHLDELSLDCVENIEDNIEGLRKGQSLLIESNCVLVNFDVIQVLRKVIKLVPSPFSMPRMPPKRTSTSAAPAMTQAAIRQLVVDSVTAAQATTMASIDNLNRNTRPRETPIAKRGNYKEFISCQPFYFNGTPTTTATIPIIAATTTKTTATTIAIATMITANNRIKDKKPSGADKSFVSISLASMLNIPPITLDTTYNIEMANENLVGLEDIPVVREFLEVFPEELPGLPPVRQVELQIEFVPGVAPVAHAPYRLAPLKMQELSNQLQELADRGFIRPSTSS